MSEMRINDKAIQKIGSMIFFGQYFPSAYGREEFQVLDAKQYTERKLANMKKKYGF
jgi:hypothetical protein